MLRTIALVAIVSLGNVAAAQTSAYPARTIHLVAGTAPGGITDTLAIEHVAKSPPDGYTLLLVAGGNVVITPFLYASLPFDPLNDIVPVFNIAGAPQLLVVPGALPVKDLAEFIALARAYPGKLNYASAGPGSTTHLAADHFARLAGVELVHVPYRDRKSTRLNS